MILKIDSPLDLQGNTVTGSGAAVNDSDLITKAYGDAIAQGIIYKEAVASVATDAVAVNAPGAIGILAAGARLLLTAQADATQNGIWTYNGDATPLTRPDDFAHAAVIKPGAAVFSDSDDTTWTLINTADVTVDTTDETWTQAASAGSLTFDAPLTKSGNEVSLNNGDPLDITDGGTGSASATAARAALGTPGKFATSIGDGATVTFEVNHNLGTKDVSVTIIDLATLEYELAAWTVNDVNNVTITFSAAPAAAGANTGKRIVVVG